MVLVKNWLGSLKGHLVRVNDKARGKFKAVFCVFLNALAGERSMNT